MAIYGPSRVEGSEELRKERERRPELAEVIDLELELLDVEARAPAFEPVCIAQEEAQALLGEGIPLLEGLKYEEALLASSEFAEQFRQACHAMARHRPELADELGHFAKVELTSIDEVELADSEEEELLAFLIRRAMRPFLVREARRLAERVKESEWREVRCPICGAEPDLAHLEREVGARQLVCAHCDTVWDFRRVGCPFCGADDPKSWGYYAGAGGRRLYMCEECRRYLKTLDLREGWQEHSPAMERILTLDMDLAAQDKGYS